LWNESFFSAPQLKRDPLGCAIKKLLKQCVQLPPLVGSFPLTDPNAQFIRKASASQWKFMRGSERFAGMVLSVVRGGSIQAVTG
jgi:hypothetical protein